MIDIENVGAFVWILLILAMVTCGAVLLINLYVDKLGFAPRVASAALASPFLVFGPVLLVADIQFDGDWWAVIIGLVFFILVIGTLIGWPISHFATKRFDRIKTSTTSVFE